MHKPADLDAIAASIAPSTIEIPSRTPEVVEALMRVLARSSASARVA